MFPSRSRQPPSFLGNSIRKHPFAYFGLPFIIIVVGASFALAGFTQTKYDYQESKVRSMGIEEELGMKKDRRKLDLREEYYRLNSPEAFASSPEPSLSSPPNSQPSQPKKEKRKKFSMVAVSQDDYEPIRIPRPEGVPEWGAPTSSGDAPMKGSRKEDRWV